MYLKAYIATVQEKKIFCSLQKNEKTQSQKSTTTQQQNLTHCHYLGQPPDTFFNPFIVFVTSLDSRAARSRLDLQNIKAKD
jgi:hypothetical protein